MLASTALGGWERTVSTGKGVVVDSPPPHPLAYYKVDPCSRPRSDKLFLIFDCTPAPEAKELERRARTTTQLREVGKIGELAAYDLWYSTGTFAPYLRSVLIETGPDEFRELDVWRPDGPLDVNPASRIVQLDGQQVLNVGVYDGGNNINSAPYILRATGAEKADFRAVANAVEHLTPSYMTRYQLRQDFATRTTTAELYRSGTNKQPESVRNWARITITYRFLDGRAVVTGSTYEPYTR